jgi:hypothetical protein
MSQKRRFHHPPSNGLATAGRILQIASEAAGLLIRLRDRPRPLDWIALGAYGAGIGHKIWSEAAARKTPCPYFAFNTDGPEPEWEIAAPILAKWILKHAHDARPLPTRADDHELVVEAALGQEAIGWIEGVNRQGVIRGPYYRRSRRDETIAALGEQIWRSAGHDHLTVRGGALVQQPPMPPMLATESLRHLETRVQQFRSRDAFRSVLLVGPPGTGKTTAARQLADRMGTRSVQIDVGALTEMLRESARHNREGNQDPCLNLQTIVDCLQPQAVLLDDIDRVGFGAEMLGVLEQIRVRVPLVIATANSYESLSSAVLRPGRFDEMVRVLTPCRELVEQMVGPKDPHLDALAEWPIAWVSEYVARRDTLGPSHANEEFEELQVRLREFSVHEKIDSLNRRANGAS